MRILIAEDDATSRKILAGYLKRWGYDVIPTADGHEAWDVLSGPDCPQLVILDWEMPGIDGDELCRRFRELDVGYYVYMVLLTGKDLKEEVVAGLESGADDYLTKPFNALELRERLNVGMRILSLENKLNEQIALVTEANEKINKDLKAASTVQQSLLPKKLPECQEYDFSYFYEPSEYLGGDMVRITQIDERYVACYMVDVSGHGVPSSLLSVTVGNQIRSLPHPEDPAKVVDRLSQHFKDLLTTTELYFTLLYGVIDTQEHIFRFCQAGHPFPLVRRSEAALEVSFNANVPVGFIEAEYETYEIAISPGEDLYIYTDGITEAQHLESNELYGVERFLEQLQGDSFGEPSSLEAMVTYVREWKGGGIFQDDVSLLRISRSK